MIIRFIFMCLGLSFLGSLLYAQEEEKTPLEETLGIIETKLHTSGSFSFTMDGEVAGDGRSFFFEAPIFRFNECEINYKTIRRNSLGTKIEIPYRFRLSDITTVQVREVSMSGIDADIWKVMLVTRGKQKLVLRGGRQNVNFVPFTVTGELTAMTLKEYFEKAIGLCGNSN